ncbi:hypothetical protein KA013_00450 [Patescibacteria group bacterium]|nr:hypothetical protein [Patescibacteria group bacterium]
MQSYLDAKNDRYIGGEVEDVRKVLLEGLAFLAQRSDLPHVLPAIEDTQRILTTDHAVQPNYE